MFLSTPILAALLGMLIAQIVKTPINFRGNESRFLDNTQYDIYVKREEEHLANEAMQKIN